MATVADYIIVRDAPFTLDGGQDQTFSFTVQNPAEVVNAKLILEFQADPTSNAQNLQLIVKVNGDTVYTLTVNDGVLRAAATVINFGVLNVGGANSVNFHAVAATIPAAGTFKISSVVLWHQRNA